MGGGGHSWLRLWSQLLWYRLMAVGTSERLKRTVSLFGGMSWWRNVLSICHSSSSTEREGQFRTVFILFIILLSATASRLCSSCLTKSIGIASLDAAPPNTSQPRTVHRPLLTFCSLLHTEGSQFSHRSCLLMSDQSRVFLRFGVHHLCFIFSLNDNSWLTGSMGDNYRDSSGYRQLKINLLLHCQYCREVELKLGVLREICEC